MSRTSNSEMLEPYVNQPIEKLAGVYFENIAHLHLYRDHWKFVNYVNLTPLEEKEKVLKFYLNKIALLCYGSFGETAGKDICSGSQELKRLQRKLVSLKTDRETIDDLIGRAGITKDINKRSVKRSVFDFVGQITKILFGTLDSTDADYYNEQIDLVYNNTKQLTDLYKKQISIIQSTIGQFSDAFEANNKKFKEIDFNLVTLTKENLRKFKKYNRNTTKYYNKYILDRMLRNVIRIRTRIGNTH